MVFEVDGERRQKAYGRECHARANTQEDLEAVDFLLDVDGARDGGEETAAEEIEARSDHEGVEGVVFFSGDGTADEGAYTCCAEEWENVNAG